MKPKDIVIGQTYKHSDFTGEYLGICQDVGNGNMKKFLLSKCINALVLTPYQINKYGIIKDGDEFWNKFYEV